MILLACYSKTGNTLTFIPFLKQYLWEEVEEDYSLSSSIKDYDRIIIGSYTWFDGKIPSKMKKYLIDNKDFLKNKKVLIFGSGNSIYPKFCKAVDSISKIVTDCGANVVGTFKFEQRFKEEEFSPDEIVNLINSIFKLSL